MVLYVVVVVVAMLSLAGLSYVTMLHTENQAVRLHGDELQIECLVCSGAEAVKGFCELTPEERESFGGGDDNAALFHSVAVLDVSLDGRGGRFSVISPRIENNEITGIRFGIQNESARLNLAVLPEWEQDYPGSGRQALLALPGMSESIADAILDWIDADGARRPFGAEAEYYAALGVPYGPRNTVPTSLEELLLVRDVTRELLFGVDENFNYRLDPHESRQRSGTTVRGAAGAGLPWASLLTLFSAERNLNPDGEPRTSLNLPDPAMLQQKLSEVLDPEWVNFIVAYRQFGPYEDEVPEEAYEKNDNEEDDAEDTIATAAEIQIDFSHAARFEIESVLDLIGVWVAIEEQGSKHRVFVESPFQEDATLMRQYLPILLDWTAIDDEPILRGRINVNLAPRPVLASVPGMDDVLIEQIVAARESGGNSQDDARRHPTWLVTEGVVDLERMKIFMPFLTAGGDVYRAQVLGYFDGPGPSGRAEVVVDATRMPPRQIYWKDLRLLGLGYDVEELGGAPSNDQLQFSTGTGGFPR